MILILISWIIWTITGPSDKDCLTVQSVSPENTVMMQDTQRIVKLVFDQSHIDLGKVKKGEKKETAFHFTNKGNEDIKIELVSACECTTLDWPRKAIPPGGVGTIDVIFDSGQKEKSETIEIDIYLKNLDPKTGYPMLEIVSYSYELMTD